MRIGVDYYPEHWDESRWSTDARLMKEAGITVVRLAEFAWCKMEPTEGHYDFAWLDRALAILQREGIQAVLGTPTATPPAWLHEHYPDIYPVDDRKYRLGFGTRLQRCLSNPTMRSYSKRITEAMVAHFAKNPNVIGWQTDNEFEANLCYCDICAGKFRDWLREKYGTLEALNAAWGTIFWSQEYSGWAQIPLPWQVRCGKSHNPSLMLDYRRFASETTVSFQHEQVEIIRRLAPQQFITHNLMGQHDSMDYYALGQDLDFVAWDNYLLGSGSGGPANPAMSHDLMRGIKQQNFWVMEQQSHILGWEKIGRRPADGQIRAWAWQSVAHGADTVVFFRWRSCLYGTEQYWHGVINHDGQPRRRYKEVAQFGREMKELSAVLDGSVVCNSVAILNSYEQNWALQIQPQVEGLAWWEQIHRFHDALSRQGIGTDVVPITVDLAQYEVVIVPSWYMLTEQDSQRLASYVRQGGTLILNPRTGVKTALNTNHPLPLPAFLAEVAGLEIDDYDPLGQAETRITFAGQEYTATVWADALLLRGAQAIGQYVGSVFSNEPAMVRHTYGQGVVYTMGIYGEPALYDALLDSVLQTSGIQRFPNLPIDLEACWRIKDGQRFLFLINPTGEDKSVALTGSLQTLLGPDPQNGAVVVSAYDVGIYSM